MDAQKAFISAVLLERQKSWNKAAAKYEELLSLIYKRQWKKKLNKEKLRLLFFECHFHCAVALQNVQKYRGALRHFRRAMEVVSWRKDECQAGCITGRVLHLHVPTLARMACCYIHEGDLKAALDNADKAILLDFRNPDLFCVRAVVNFLLHRQEKALSDASFAIQLSPAQVCSWLLRGLFKKIKREANDQLKTSRQEQDLDKACEVNPDAVMFINIKDLRSHFQSIFDRLLPSTRVSHSISVRDVVDIKIAAMQPCHSSQTFRCGVAKPQRRIRTCPSQEKKHSERFLERFHSEPSISHHKYSLNANSRLSERPTSHTPLSSNTCKSRVSHLTLKDVVDTKRACFCRGEKFIGIRDHQERQVGLEPSEEISDTSERMYSRKWLQDRIPTKIPDIAGCRKLP